MWKVLSRSQSTPSHQPSHKSAISSLGNLQFRPLGQVPPQHQFPPCATTCSHGACHMHEMLHGDTGIACRKGEVILGLLSRRSQAVLGTSPHVAEALAQKMNVHAHGHARLHKHASVNGPLFSIFNMPIQLPTRMPMCLRVFVLVCVCVCLCLCIYTSARTCEPIGPCASACMYACMSCHVMSRHVTSRHVMSCHVGR